MPHFISSPAKICIIFICSLAKKNLTVKVCLYTRRNKCIYSPACIYKTIRHDFICKFAVYREKSKQFTFNGYFRPLIYNAFDTEI